MVKETFNNGKDSLKQGILDRAKDFLMEVPSLRGNYDDDLDLSHLTAE